MAARVLYLHGIAEIGGAERDLLALLTKLNRTKWQPLVACPIAGPFGAELKAIDVPVHAMDFPPWRKLSAYPCRLAAIRRLRELVAVVRPELIHVNDFWWVPQALRASKGGPLPVVTHVRQEIEPLKVRRYALDRPERVVAVSRHIQQSLQMGGVRPERLRTVYSGLAMQPVPSNEYGRNLRHRFGISAEAFVLGTVANVFPRKGYEVMLRALPAVQTSVPNVHYLIVGRGDVEYEKALRSLARGLKIAERVHFAGFQGSVHPCLAAMDLYVHPALMEGFGIAVIEAMAMSKPVVATTAGGLPEIVLNDRTGILVPPGDSDALAKAVVLLVRDPARREEMGEAGRKRVLEQFSLDASIAAVENIYEGLICGRSG